MLSVSLTVVCIERQMSDVLYFSYVIPNHSKLCNKFMGAVSIFNVWRGGGGSHWLVGSETGDWGVACATL